MSDSPVEVSVADDVMTVTLNRPEARNAMDKQSWIDLVAALESVPQRQARAVVLTGAGGAFSAGGDLKSMHTEVLPGIYGRSQRLLLAHQAIRTIVQSRVPVVAAVDGPAAGVGWSMALACDVVVASESAFFVAPFLDRGLVPDGGLGWLLTASVGRHRALGMILSRQRISAADAHAAGFVHRISPKGQALEQALTIARELAAGPTETIGLLKSLVCVALDSDFDGYLNAERDSVLINRDSGNPAEGVAAWRESREPQFLSGYTLPD